MKRLWYVVFCVFGICAVNNGYSQNIKDYFYPSDGTYIFSPPNNPTTYHSNEIIYLGNNEYNIWASDNYVSNYGVTTGMQTILITDDQIICKGGMLETRPGKIVSLSKNNIILKLPKPNRPISWKDRNMVGIAANRLAKLVTLNIPIVGGTKAINAIEVSVNGTPIEYWAQGYGLVFSWGNIRRGFDSRFTVSKYYDVEKKEREDRERREREEREAKEKREREERIRKERADSLLLKRIYEGEIFSNNEIKDKPKLTIDFSRLSKRWRKVGNLDGANQSYSLIKNRSLTIDILKNGTITNFVTEDPTSSEKLSDILTGVTCINSGKIMVRGKAHNIDFRERLGYQQCFCRKDEKNYDIILLLKKSKKGLTFERKKVKYYINSDDMAYIQNLLKTDKTIESLPNGKYNLIVKTNWVFRIKLENISPNIGAGFLEKRFYSISCKTKKENINIDID